MLRTSQYNPAEATGACYVFTFDLCGKAFARILVETKVGTLDLADLYGIWTAAHNPASPVGTAASAHAASSMRNFRVHELANWVDWWPTLVTREGPYWKDGYFHIEDKPGLGFDLNPDVARAHLAPGEVWWG